MGECRDRLLGLKRKLDEFAKIMQLASKQEEITRYEMRMGDPAFWPRKSYASASPCSASACHSRKAVA